MIKIVAVSTLKPGVLQDYLQAAAELIEKSNQEDDETKVAMFEEWKDEEAIELHNNSEHFTRICPQLSKYCVGDSVVTFYKEI